MIKIENEGIKTLPRWMMSRFCPLLTTNLLLPWYSIYLRRLSQSATTWLVAPLSRNQEGSRASVEVIKFAKFELTLLEDRTNDDFELTWLRGKLNGLRLAIFAVEL